VERAEGTDWVNGQTSRLPEANFSPIPRYAPGLTILLLEIVSISGIHKHFAAGAPPRPARVLIALLAHWRS
jgi:hypothetical protein